MSPGTVFVCDHNGIVLLVHRDDSRIFGAAGKNEHLSQYITANSGEVATRFFSLLSSEGLSVCSPIEFVINSTAQPLFCIGMRLRDCFLLFGASSLPNLGTLITGTLYSDEVPVDLAPICGADSSRNSSRLPDYQVYEDLTRLNNELVDMSRELTDARVEIEMEADELNKEIQVRKQTEEALSRTNKKLTLLSGITRHDINNQLTVLMGYLSILETKPPDSTSHDYFKKVKTAAERISAMIRFTKEYEEIGVLAPAWQNCRSLVDTAATQAPLGKVIVKNDLAAGTEVFADPLIVKVFYNLMDNAARYGGKITTIRFFFLRSGDDQIIVCEDDGDGVVRDEKEKIFERGFGKNTGLGLAISREILDITGISIKETGEPGVGARFEMVVPKRAWRMTEPGRRAGSNG